jgi:hypothetical protein
MTAEETKAASRRMSCGCAEDAGGQKNFGDASLHPRAFQTDLEEAYLFFFLAFFFAAILFSSQLSESHASHAGGARIQSPCIRIARNLVKRKVIARSRKLQKPSRDFGATYPASWRHEPSRATDALVISCRRESSGPSGLGVALAASGEDCI